MRRYDPDSPLMGFLTRLAELAWLNILWLLTSLPLVTAGAAAAGLCRCVMNMVREEGAWDARAYFRTFRESFRAAVPLWLALLAAAGLLGADLWILSAAAFPGVWLLRGLAVPGLALWGLTAVWVFPLTAHFENSFRGTIKNALLLGLGWLPRSLGMLFLWAAPGLLLALSPRAFFRVGILWPLFGWALTAYACALLMKKPLTPYWEPEDGG